MDALFRAGLWLAARCSQGVAVRTARLVARLLLALNTESVRVTRANLEVCFPHLGERARRELCHDSLTHMVLLVFEFGQLSYWPLAALLDPVEVVGREHLDQAFASGQGVLLLVPHFGNWEILCAFLGTRYSVAALYDRPKIRSLEPAILAARQRYEGEMYPIDTGGMRSILRTLKTGKLVAVLPDQVPDRDSGVYAPFFDEPALTMTLPQRLIERTRPQVLMGSVRRVFWHAHQYGYEVTFEPLGEDASAAGDIAAVINRAIERIVERAPQQYQWEYKRFKRPPAGGPNLYRRQ